MKDITNSQIWIGDNIELARKIANKLYEMGYDDTHSACPIEKNPSCLFVHSVKTFGAYGQDYTKKSFDAKVMAGDSNKEIFPSDILEELQTYEIY